MYQSSAKNFISQLKRKQIKFVISCKFPRGVYREGGG